MTGKLRDAINFEQFVKASGDWHKLMRYQKELIRGISSGEKRTHIFYGRDMGKTTVRKLYDRYKKEVLNKPPREIQRTL